MGFARKRTCTKPAIIRYACLSPTKDPEKYYQSQFQLFLPYYVDSDLKPQTFESYDFYNLGMVCNATNDVST